MLPDDHKIALIKLLEHANDARLLARHDYYKGEVLAPYLTAKLRETLGSLADSMVENYCALAIDARIDRLEVTGFDGPGEVAAQTIWDEGGYKQRQDQWFRWSLIEGASYLIVQDDVIVANPARVAYAEPATNDWLGVNWAGKVWQDGTRWRASLWDEESIYHYESGLGSASEWITQRSWNATTIASGLQYVGEERHGYDQIPVFPVHPYGDGSAPLLDKIAPVQDRINKIIANQMVILESSAFKQRVYFTRQQVDPYDLRQEPDTAIILDPGDAEGRASVVELGGTDLSGLDDLKDKTIDSLFTIAALPRHMRVNPASPPSGEAIKSDESPFVKAIFNHQREFGQAFTMALDLLGIQAEPVWEDPQTRNDDTAARVVETLVNAGIPWQTAVTRYLGFTPDEIAEAQNIAKDDASGVMADLRAQTEAFLTNPLL